jgi:outer membrane protein OmpA-like peptidoglycan-associated protein
MFATKNTYRGHTWVASLLALTLFAGCATSGGTREPYVTKRDRTVKGAGVGAAAGAVGAVLAGKREADEILAGAAIGAVVGGGVGAYMDRQQEKLARIPGTSVERVGEDTLLVHFDSDILFDVNSAVIDSGGRATLEDVAGVLNEYPKTAVVVQGHTDSTGSEELNQTLSERRATSVKNYLASRGVDDDRMAALGFGEGSPVASNDSESGRQQNRRVDILLKANAGPVRGEG